MYYEKFYDLLAAQGIRDGSSRQLSIQQDQYQLEVEYVFRNRK